MDALYIVMRKNSLNIPQGTYFELTEYGWEQALIERKGDTWAVSGHTNLILARECKELQDAVIRINGQGKPIDLDGVRRRERIYLDPVNRPVAREVRNELRDDDGVLLSASSAVDEESENKGTESSVEYVAGSSVSWCK